MVMASTFRRTRESTESAGVSGIGRRRIRGSRARRQWEALPSGGVIAPSVQATTGSIEPEQL
jgi:hypothetical protein